MFVNPTFVMTYDNTLSSESLFEKCRIQFVKLIELRRYNRIQFVKLIEFNLSQTKLNKLKLLE